MVDDQTEYQEISVPFGTKITVEFPEGLELLGDDAPHLRSLSWVAGPLVPVRLDRSSSGEQSPPSHHPASPVEGGDNL